MISSEPKDLTTNMAFKGFTNLECPFLPCHPGVRRVKQEVGKEKTIDWNCLFCR